MVKFSQYRPPYYSVPKVFTALRIDVVLKCRKIFRTGPSGNRRNRVLFTGHLKKQNFGSLSNSLLRGARPTSARASPQHLAHNVLNFIQIGSPSAEL